MVRDLSNRVANYFSQREFTKGDSVAIYMENRPEYVCLWLGLAKVRHSLLFAPYFFDEITNSMFHRLVSSLL